jgi:hypothetical protein
MHMQDDSNVFVDVDDTLIRSFGSKVIPNTRVIDKVVSLQKRGFKIYVWSSGGAEYSQKMATQVGIGAIVSGYFAKPKYIIDDQDVEKWINTKVIHPLQIDNID